MRMGTIWSETGLRYRYSPGRFTCQNSSYVNINIEGIWQTILSKANYNQYICQEKEKQHYIAVVQ